MNIKATINYIHKSPSDSELCANINVSLTQAREWYESDDPGLKELAQQLFTDDQLHVKRPDSWDELCDIYRGKVYRSYDGVIKDQDITSGIDHHKGVDCLPTKELAEAHIAMSQLLFLHHMWIGGWKPNWDDHLEPKYCITPISNRRVDVVTRHSDARPLHFKTVNDAREFSRKFKSLIDKAYGLF